MMLGTAILLLAAMIIGMVLTDKYLRERWALRIICVVLLLPIAVVLTCYVGLTVIFTDAARNQPPMLRQNILG